MSATIGLDHDDLLEVRAGAFDRLMQAIERFEGLIASGRVHATFKDGEERWLQWEAVEAAYRALRALYVPPRRTGWARHGFDPTLEAWIEASRAWRERCFGPDAPSFISDVMGRYQKLQSKWHKKSPTYRKCHRKYMRKYMAAKRAAAKAVAP